MGREGHIVRHHTVTGHNALHQCDTARDCGLSLTMVTCVVLPADAVQPRVQEQGNGVASSRQQQPIWSPYPSLSRIRCGPTVRREWAVRQGNASQRRAEPMQLAGTVVEVATPSASRLIAAPG